MPVPSSRYLINRIAYSLIVTWAFLTVLFVMVRMMPGDPATIYSSAGLSLEKQQQLIERLGLNEPLHVQYYEYLTGLLQGEMGHSFMYNGPVFDILVFRFLNTITIMITALIMAFIFGILGGALLADKRGSDFEVLGLIGILIARSSPVFWVGMLSIVIFSIELGWFPSGGMRSVSAEQYSFIGRYASMDFIKHAILPLTVTTIYFMTLPTLVMRNSMIEILDADFIESKRAAGLNWFTILYKHAVRNSLLPIVTLAAILGGQALGGQVLIEVVFNWPGMGKLMVDAVSRVDYPLAIGSFMIMGTAIIWLNFVADVLYGLLDPRVSYE